jgi:hypothetical protein
MALVNQYLDSVWLDDSGTIAILLFSSRFVHHRQAVLKIARGKSGRSGDYCAGFVVAFVAAGIRG